jgi:hypothetical protein
MKKQPDTLAPIRALRRAFRDEADTTTLWRAVGALRRRLSPQQTLHLIERYEARWSRPVLPRADVVTVSLSPELTEALTPWCEQGENVGALALKMLHKVAEFGPPQALNSIPRGNVETWR